MRKPSMLSAALAAAALTLSLTAQAENHAPNPRRRAYEGRRPAQVRG